MDLHTITYATSGGIARITLNRPDRLNSFTSAMHEELAAALSAAQFQSHTRCNLRARTL